MVQQEHMLLFQRTRVQPPTQTGWFTVAAGGELSSLSVKLPREGRLCS